MNIYKTDTEYTSKGKLYCAEVFAPGHMLTSDVIKMRCLPNEVVSSDSILAVSNHSWNQELNLEKESVASYIYDKHYVDAVHRLMYLILIKGQTNVDMFEFMKDDGLIHELLHLKSHYVKVDVNILINQANGFESIVPGTFLWSMLHIKT